MEGKNSMLEDFEAFLSKLGTVKGDGSILYPSRSLHMKKIEPSPFTDIEQFTVSGGRKS